MKISTGSRIDEPAELISQVVYELNGITYVPHYRNSDIFVGPGYPKKSQMRYSAKELELYGAKARQHMLWSRGKGGEVSDKYL